MNDNSNNESCRTCNGLKISQNNGRTTINVPNDYGMEPTGSMQDQIAQATAAAQMLAQHDRSARIRSEARSAANTFNEPPATYETPGIAGTTHEAPPQPARAGKIYTSAQLFGDVLPEAGPPANITPNFTLAETSAATVLGLSGSAPQTPIGVVLFLENDGLGIKTKIKFKYKYDDDDDGDDEDGIDLGKFVRPHPRKNIFEGPGGVRQDPTFFDPTPPSTGEERPPVSGPLPFVDPGQDVIDQLWEDYARQREHPLFPGKFKGGRDEGWAPFYPYQPPLPVLRPKSGVAGPWPLGRGVSGGLWGGGMLGDPAARGATGGFWIKLGDVRIWVGGSATGPDDRGHVGGGGEIGGSILWD